MNNKAEIRPANLFFVELIIALLFFSLSAAIILRVFASADSKQKLGELTEKSIVCAQSIAECYSVSGDAALSAQQVFGTSVVFSEGEAVLSLDSGLEAAGEEQVRLTLSEISRETTAAGEFSRLRIEFTAGETQLHSLICSAYIPTGGAADEG